MLILASSSPRRRELLEIARIPFAVETAPVDESPLAEESAAQLTQRLARDKVLAIADKFPSDFILGADTVVVLNHSAEGAQVLGKPNGPADAARMLRALSGRGHQVVTGVCLLSSVAGASPARRMRTEAVSTTVTMATISEVEIAAYVATGEPLDKAGAYAIQGMASRWITGIEGCYYNVVGLPLPVVYQWLVAEGLV